MNAVSVWFELPTVDLERAVAFYSAVLGHPMRRETAPCGQLEMAVFDPADTELKGALVKGADFTPNATGTMVYLNAGDDLAGPLARAEAAGGRVVMPKTSIAPHGYIAAFIDSEGNRVGLHSMA